AFIAEDAMKKGLKSKSEFTITPGSEMVRYTIERDGMLHTFDKMGGVVLANACGPCIGQWARHMDDPTRKNTIVTSFNRNFAKRNDGFASTHAFVASPEIVTAYAISGRLSFNPLKDKLVNDKGEEVMLDEPKGYEMPPKGFSVKDAGYQAPAADGSKVEILVDPASTRLQLLEAFSAWEGTDLHGLKLLIKAFGKCTTDHISMAGPWLKYRGHLDNISNNMLIGAINAFNMETNKVKNQLTGEFGEVPQVQRAYKAANIGSVVVGDENYGEGSSREHAAMEPRHLGVRAIVVKSFARIHETNLKKQGMLALTFANKEDYDKVQEDDVIDFIGLKQFTPGEQLIMVLNHKDGSMEEVLLNHTYNQQQIEWFRAGGALNVIRQEFAQ
ncbi:MAG: aconitate hydratase, partial [Flavipsychrobacter sp.]|nr:aconitate hydratase [Flavipsychrobacter sp.]